MNIIDTLLELQKKDCTIRDIEQELRDIPARQSEEETRLDEYKAALAEAEEHLKAKQAAIKDVELEIDTGNEKADKLRTQQLELKTNKEFKAMEAEINGVLAGVSRMEDKQLLIMEDVEAAREAVEEKNKILADKATDVEADKKVHGERADALQRELDSLKAAREEESKDVDSEWLSRYNMIIGRKDRALVPVDNGVCGGCHMKVPPAVMHAAATHDTMVLCDYCGRLLY